MIDTLEGIINGQLWYHYDVTSDVLYLRLAEARDVATVAEESDDGLLLLRTEDDDALVGITVVNWWRRFGQGDLPDSLRELHRRIEPWGQRLAA